jgi:hypothetical protein
MVVFLELTTDPYESKVAQRAKEAAGTSGRAGLAQARRPVRGIEIKEDTYAMMKVVKLTGEEVDLFDQSSPTGRSKQTASFLLQAAQEQRMEKHQIIETFGEPYIFFFGEAPRFLDCEAVLLNTHDFNWEAEWWKNWEEFFRGTKAIEMGARTYMFYDDTVVEGYMVMATAVKHAQQPYHVTLTWKMFVCSSTNISSIGDPNFPVRNSAWVTPEALRDPTGVNQMIDEMQAAQRFIDETERAAANASTGEFGSQGRLARYLRLTPPSQGFSPSLQAEVDDARRLGLGYGTWEKALRGKIADNADEIVGRNTAYIAWWDIPLQYQVVFPENQEVIDLTQSTMRWCDYYGADGMDHRRLNDMGLGPRFAPNQGIPIGFGSCGAGAGGNAGATFGARAGAGVGFGGSVGNGYGYMAGARAGFTSGAGARSYAGAGSSNSFSSSAGSSAFASTGSGAFARSSDRSRISARNIGRATARASAGASAGYGAYAGASFSAGASTGSGSYARANSYSNVGVNNRYGDAEYGYRSPYAPGPGYGRRGYGDYGGRGHGSAFGSRGDPGHIAPDRFDYQGVGDDQAALERFLTPDTGGYGTGFGGRNAAGAHVGTGAGAGVHVGGRPTAFAFVAMEGELRPNGRRTFNTITSAGTTVKRPVERVPPHLLTA